VNFKSSTNNFNDSFLWKSSCYASAEIIYNTKTVNIPDLMVFRVTSINFIDPSSYKDDDDKVVVDIKPKNSCT
jgi:hypothetical protein